MSDFLTHLVARTIAQPALRPRTQSRFEPPAVEEAPLVWPVTANSVSSRDALDASPAAEAPEPEAEREPEKPQATRPPIRNAAPPEQSKNVPQPTGEQPVAREVVASEPRTVHVPRVSTRVVREVEHDVERVVETNERVVAVPQRIESEPRTIIRSARPHRFEHQPPRVIRERQQGDAIHHQREIRTTIDRPPRFIRDRTEPSGAAPRAEPVIEVSIGRIEVRAVSSGTPQRQQPSSRNTAMTIDDYVAKRKAKERR